MADSKDKDYEKILEGRRDEALDIFKEAQKIYRQTLANFKAADRELTSWREKQGGNHGIYTKQENDGARNSIS